MPVGRGGSPSSCEPLLVIDMLSYYPKLYLFVYVVEILGNLVPPTYTPHTLFVSPPFKSLTTGVLKVLLCTTRPQLLYTLLLFITIITCIAHWWWWNWWKTPKWLPILWFQSCHPHLWSAWPHVWWPVQSDAELPTWANWWHSQCQHG